VITYYAFATDPGVKYLGHAKLALELGPTGGRLYFVRGGRRAPERGWLLGELAVLKAEGGAFAVEVMVGGRFRGRKTEWLNQTAEMQGWLCSVAQEAGIEPQRIPAGDGPKPKPRKATKRRPAPPPEPRVMGWRRDLCGDSMASDEQIAIVVEGIVGGIREIRKTDREHMYDAIGLACVVLARRLGIKIKLPRAVQTALWMQQQKEREQRSREVTRRAAAKALGGTLALPAFVAPKRSKTRVQRTKATAGARAVRGKSAQSM